MRNLKTTILILMVGLLISCEKDDLTNEEPINDLLIKGTAILVTEDARIPIILQHINGGKAAILDKDEDGIYDGLVYADGEDKLVIELDQNTGLPTKLTTSDNAVILYNYKNNNTLLDVAIVKEGGDISYIRDVEIDISKAVNTLDTKYSGDPLEVIRGAVSAISLAWSAGVCIFTASSSFASLGATIPATIIACGGFLADFLLFAESASGINNQYSQQINNVRSLLSLFSDYSGCLSGNISDCFSIGLSAVDGLINITEAIQQLIGILNIELAEGALLTGYGAVKVTLTWNTTSDIDLWVTDPNNERIFYENIRSQSGGVLDVDDTDGFGPENIFWQQNPPIGEYIVQVHYYGNNGQGTTNYTVQIETENWVQILNGSLTVENQLNNVATFNITNQSNKISTITKLNTYKIIDNVLKKSKERI